MLFAVDKAFVHIYNIISFCERGISMGRPLEGIKVLDLTTFVAAPCTCRLLADLGAEVIKIERSSGDGWRYSAIAQRQDEFSMDENPVYDIYNAGKKHITLNLKSEEGKKIFKALLKQSDIFVTNTRLAALKRLGISYEEIKGENSRLIYAMVEGFGEKGPECNTGAYDTTAFWARCGMLNDLAVVHDDGSHIPIYPPSSVGDTATAYILLSEIITALYEREKTGKGQVVKAGLFHTGIFTFGTMQIVTQKPFGKVYPMKNYEHSIIAGAYMCADGRYVYIATGVPNDTYIKLVGILGIDYLLNDSRFKDYNAASNHKKEFKSIVSEKILEKTRDEWLEIFKENDIASGVVNSFSDISEDEQAIANGYIEDVTFRNGKTAKMPSCPFHIESLEGEDLSTHPAAPIGYNNGEVLSALGYTAEDIKRLKSEGVI